LLAEEAAASPVAVESAVARRGSGASLGYISRGAAKIRAGEAAGKVAEIAHQVHGANGFTHEHSLHRLTRGCGRGATSSAPRATGRASSAKKYWRPAPTPYGR